MATKKSQSKAQAKPAAMPQASAGMDSRTTWRWVYVLGGLVAALAGAFSFENQFLTWALMLVGILVGWFYGDTEDLTNTGVRYLLLAAVYNALATVPAVGTIITGFVGGFLGFLGPMMLALLLRWFWNSVVSRMM
ncbi:MAG: hypothetical protein AB1607_12950 [Chloroflexota bacterium]